MQLGLISINFSSAPIEIREQAAFSDTKKMALYESLRNHGFQQSIIVSTCNRSELYFMMHDQQELSSILPLFEDCFDMVIHPYLMIKCDQDAVIYLFEVCAGFQSQVFGEDQILGQMKDAAEFARHMGCCGKQISKFFKDAVTTAKKLKRELKISEHPLSLSYIGIQLLVNTCGIKDKKVLVLGSGKMAQLAIRYLCSYGAAQIWNCNRSQKYVQQFASEFPDVIQYPFSQRYELLSQCDIVVSATSSPHLVLTYQPLKHPVVMLDLAVPRDIDPRYPQVYNLDSLQMLADEQLLQRKQKAKEGYTMIQEAVKASMHWLSVSYIDAGMQTLQERAEAIAYDTYAILERKLDLTKREQFILKKTLHASMQRMIKEPLLQLKMLDDKQTQQQYLDMIQQLFDKEGASYAYKNRN